MGKMSERESAVSSICILLLIVNQHRIPLLDFHWPENMIYFERVAFLLETDSAAFHLPLPLYLNKPCK